MNLSDLKYLIAVAEHRHFGHAADECNISQPTLSTQLKKLEAELGVALLERTNRSVSVTDAGEQVLRHARNILAEADMIRQVGSDESRPMSGHLRIGCIPTLAPYMLPWLLPALVADYPDLIPVLVEDMTAHLTESLINHDLDVGFMALPLDGDELATEALFDESFLVACHPDHPFAATEAVLRQQLAEEDVLYLDDGHCMRDQTMEICGRPSSGGLGGDFRAASLETLRQLVKAGFGVTLLPAMAVSGSNHDGRIAIRPFAGPAFRRVGAVWRKSFPRPDDIRLLCQTVRRAAPGVVSLIDD
ncbi:LysR family transcriptional regulator [Alphaproteobacteria bacterium HT1-32]|nr:LysR family transcriptional regulator [Alphaproteobacteria bacterium HT1-32]|tara:strand:+ start:73571 stop:74479 length:909 start_codon:yes stop_codon:yes gene_type:complete